jgi:hypothetical protein
MRLHELFPQASPKTPLNEIEIGGDVDSDILDELIDKNDFTPKQLTLFPDVPSEPTIPKTLELVGRLGPYYVVKHFKKKDQFYPSEWTYYLFDSGKPVAYVCLVSKFSPVGDYSRVHRHPSLTGTGFRVISVFLYPEVRGKNLAVALYKWLLRNVCDYLLPDDTHTPGGVHVWKQLLRDPELEMMIYNIENHDYYRAKPGAVWQNVYRSDNLIPFVALTGKAEALID